MYISLPSDGGGALFRNNTTSKYIVKLPKEVKLQRGEFQIGMVSCSWPFNFDNVPAFSLTVGVMIGGSLITAPPVQFYGGYFRKLQDLLDRLNDTLNAAALDVPETVSVAREENGHICLFKTTSNGKVTFEKTTTDPDVGGVYVGLSEALHAKLGFVIEPSMTSFVWVTTGTTGAYYPDLDAGLSSIYVYCSAMRPERIVADRLCKVLRILPITGDPSRNVYYQPNHVEYFQMSTNHFDEISVELRDDRGELIPFKGGKVVIDLHLKKRFI